MVYLWRAVDHEGEILESFITRKRDKSVALTFLKRALKRHGQAEKIVADGLRSYPAAMNELGNQDRRAVGRWLNNRAENSHLAFPRRERAMLPFRQMKSLQKFASVQASTSNPFKLERHLVDRETFKARRSAALAGWQLLASQVRNLTVSLRKVESGSHPTDSTRPLEASEMLSSNALIIAMRTSESYMAGHHEHRNPDWCRNISRERIGYL